MINRACIDWGELTGKTIKRVTLDNHFDRNTIVLIFTDKTYALMESSLPEAEIELKKD